jgi:hypothetical protein
MRFSDVCSMLPQAVHTIVCQKKNGHLPIFLIVQVSLTCAAIVATLRLRACPTSACSSFSPPELMNSDYSDFRFR